MANKDIYLTWKNEWGVVVTERCLLVDEDQEVTVGDTGIVIPDILPAIANTGSVMFQDAEGLFVLDTDQIVSIEGIN